MALEDLTGTNKFIDALDEVNPDGPTDQKHEGDDHIRGVKNVLKNCFEFITGKLNASHTELNLMIGVASKPATETDSQAGDAALDAAKIEANDYAATNGTVGGTVKMRVSGSNLYIRNDGTNA